MEAEVNKASSTINIGFIEDKIAVRWHMTILVKDNKQEGYLCLIPSVGIAYVAKEFDSIMSKGKKLTKAYFDFFLVHQEKNRLKRLAIELHKRGFKTKNDTMVMRKYVTGHAVPATFGSSPHSIPDNFTDSRKIRVEESLEVAY